MAMSFEPGAPLPEGFIPLCVPEIRGNEWKYIKECLDAGFVSSVGAYVDRFEKGIAGRVGTRYAVATSSGTAAVHIALLVAGVEPEDEVLISALTFIAPVNAIRYVGAYPVFVDAEPVYWQMDVQKAVDFLEHECHWANGELRDKANERRVRAIMPVHILGHPVNMQPLIETARKYKLIVIEDATESLGAKYKDQAVGQIGDIACLSFNGNKLITTGGGGMIVTDHEAWAQRAKYLTTQAKDDPLEFVHGAIGYNYRLTNIQAALGAAQLEQLDEFIAFKRRIAEVYMRSLGSLPGIQPMREAEWAFSAFWMFTILIDAKEFGMDSRALMRYLDQNKIQTRPLWQPGHLSPAHRGNRMTNCSISEGLNRNCLSLPCSVGLSKLNQERVIKTIKDAQKRVSFHV
jgi:perosamine synthetase